MIKKIEDKYKKLDDIEHVILKPSMYIGSTKSHSTTKWLLNIDKFEKREVTYNPGFLKLIDEIVINSIDESKRPESKLNIVNINIIDNKITVWDNGGIPVVKHKEYNEYIPEIIFSNMRAGSNFTESDDRTWSGTNGVGSSIVNIFSKEFIVSTSDGKNQFTQIFSNNMRDRTKAKITKSTKKFTEISFTPDLERFGLSKIDYDHFLMIEKRVYDLAGCNPNIKFTFNGNTIKINSFEDYIKLYTDEYFFEANKEKTWALGIAISENGFQQISFANSTETYDGGTHVDYIMNQIVVQLREFFLKKHKVDIKPNELKSHMTLILDTTIINPSFSSQTKEKLITEVKEFGSTYEVSNKLIQSILKSEIVNSILDWINQKKDADANKLQRDLNKKLSKIKVDKLIDAKGKDRWKCSLALFEGDSALSGFRKYRNSETMGSFCLRGKFTNVSDISNQKLSQNTEAVNIMAAIGLKLGQKIELKDLRYGKILMYTDADCLHEDTLILTENGNKKISDISYNDKVLTHTGEYKKILNIIEKDKYSYIKIVINGNNIICSENHKFLIYRDDEIMEVKASEIRYTDSFLLKK